MTAPTETRDLTAAAREFVERLQAGHFDGCLCEKLAELSLPLLDEVLRCLGIKLSN